MAEVKTSALPVDTTPLITDRVVIISDPSTTPVSSSTLLSKIKTLFGVDTLQTSVDGWTPATGTWTYASATTITVPAGATGIYSDYCKLRWKQGGGWKYAYGKLSSDTVMVIYAGSDYTVAEAAITDVYYSNAATPVGFPNSFSWTPTLTGWSSVPTGSYIFSINGKQLVLSIQQFVDGTSDSASLRITPPLPLAESDINAGIWLLAKDNGSFLAAPGSVYYVSATNYLRFDKVFGTAENWTTSGAKRVKWVGTILLP